mmetsp:Transcript_3199/g.11454  ORF Transcript_3199/g.11454 Transcript_3199/m.11454 type:complete len:249 (+) Transcript_3199:26-772(+)
MMRARREKVADGPWKILLAGSVLEGRVWRRDGDVVTEPRRRGCDGVSHVEEVVDVVVVKVVEVGVVVGRKVVGPVVVSVVARSGDVQRRRVRGARPRRRGGGRRGEDGPRLRRRRRRHPLLSAKVGNRRKGVVAVELVGRLVLRRADDGRRLVAHVAAHAQRRLALGQRHDAVLLPPARALLERRLGGLGRRRRGDPRRVEGQPRRVEVTRRVQVSRRVGVLRGLDAVPVAGGLEGAGAAERAAGGVR